LTKAVNNRLKDAIEKDLRDMLVRVTGEYKDIVTKYIVFGLDNQKFDLEQIRNFGFSELADTYSAATLVSGAAVTLVGSATTAAGVIGTYSAYTTAAA
jgi:hypothetical protein